jgi:DNA-binding transcriptional MerR regulator
MPKFAQRHLADSFPAGQAAKLSGLTLHMLNYLSRYEVVIASGSIERGRGKRRMYTYADVLLLRVLAQLLNQGVSVLGLRNELTAYRKRSGGLPDISTGRYFVTNGYTVYLQNRGRLENLATGQQAFSFVLDMRPIREDLQKQIEQMYRSAAS